MQFTTDHVDTFAGAYTAVSGLVHVVETVADAAETIVGILTESSATRVALANLPDAWAVAIENACRAAGAEVMREPFDAASLPHALDAVQVGITGMAFGIAQTGTLVEVATNDAVRLVSGLPRTHIALVRASDLVPRFEDAAPRIREIFSRHGSNCVISFISGPSRTGDIELILTLGVHGPETAHAIIIPE